ncbi:hypothetical protein ABBQ38_003883 [Trebouxia sp. C0009 RCD-2024]
MSQCVEQHQESEHDPTLASCCQRDLAQQAQDWKCLQQLQAADRSTVRTDMTTAVLATPSVSAQQAASHASSETSSDTEAELQHFRDMRLQQLKQAKQQTHLLESQGHGVLTEVSQAHCQALITSETLLLCHMFVNGVQASEQLNEHLNMVAHEHLHVRFVYVRATQSTAATPAMGAVPIPGLVLYHNGELSRAAPLHAFGDAMSVEEDQVHRWLKSKLVGSSLTSKVADQSDEEAEEDDKACSLCGRRYQHEHIRSVYQGAHQPDSQESDESS